MGCVNGMLWLIRKYSASTLAKLESSKPVATTSADVLMPYSFNTSNMGFDGDTIPSTALHCLLDIALASFLEINCGMNGK